MTNKEITFIIKARNAAKTVFAQVARDIRAAAQASSAHGRATKTAAKAADTYARSATKAARAVRDAGKAAGSTNLKKPFQEAEKEVEKLSGNVINLRALLGGLTAGALVGGGVKLYADFTREMSVFGAVTRASADEMKIATQAARDLGAVSEASASEAADAMTVFARKGYTVKESIDAAGAAINLMIVSGTDMATVAQVMSEAMNQFGIAASDAPKIADIFANLDNISAAGIIDAGEAFSYSGNLANQAGMDFNTLGAAFGVMADAGTLGSRAGTEMVNVIQSMLNPTDKAHAAMATLGLTMKDLDPTDLAGSMEKLGAAFKSKGFTDQQALSKLFDIFDIRGGRAASVLIRNTEKLRDFDAQLRNSGGTAQEAADRIGNNLTGDFRKLQSAAEETAQAIGEAGIGRALRFLTQMVDVAVTAIGNFVKWMQDLGPAASFVIKALVTAAGAFGTLVAVTTAWGLAVRALALLKFIGALGGVARAIALVRGAFLLLNTTMLTTPLGWLILGLAGAVAIYASLKEEVSGARAELEAQGIATAEGAALLEQFRAEAEGAVKAEEDLKAKSHGAAEGMAAGGTQADAFAQKLRNLGVTAQWAAFQLSLLEMNKAEAAHKDARRTTAAAKKVGGRGGTMMEMGATAQEKDTLHQFKVAVRAAQTAKAALDSALKGPGGNNTEFKNGGGLGVGTGMPDAAGGSDKKKKDKAGEDAAKKYEQALKSLISTYIPAKDRARELAEGIALVTKAMGAGDLSIEEGQHAVQRLQETLGSAGDAIGQFQRAQADELAVMKVAEGQRDELRERMELEKQAREDGLSLYDKETKKRIDASMAMWREVRALTAAEQATKNYQAAMDNLASIRASFAIEAQAADLYGPEREKFIAMEQERMRLQTERQALINQGKTEEALTQAQINELVAEYGRILDANFQRQAARNGNWMAGLKDGWMKWLEEASNVSQQVSSTVGNVLNGLTDLFTQFVTTGKASFKEFARSAVAEIMKIIAKILLMKAIQAAGSMMGIPIPTFHSGGRIGSGSGAQTRVDPAVFAGARRMHEGGRVGGLRPGERPIIAKVGERMLNEDETRAYEAGKVRGLGGAGTRRAGPGGGSVAIGAPQVAISFAGAPGGGEEGGMDELAMQKVREDLQDDLSIFMEDWLMNKMRPGGPLFMGKMQKVK